MSVTKQTLFRLIIEVLIYAALVSVYLALVAAFSGELASGIVCQATRCLCVRGHLADDCSVRRTGATGVHSGPCHPTAARALSQCIFRFLEFISIRFT